MSKDESVIEFGAFKLNPGERSLESAAGQPIQLTRKLYDTLLYMLERPGRLIEKQALLDAVWKGSVVEENTLSRTISALRQALGERAGEKRYIETVSGVGYRFIQQVNVTRAPAHEPHAHRRDPSLAVLPFEDLSREHDQGYFADGVAEEVLSRLANVPGLRLIARTSSFAVRGGGQSAREIGRKLGVDYLLTGSVRKDGLRLRVTAQLIEAVTDSQRWSERFDRELELTHIFAIQDDISRAVTKALRASLGVDEATTEPATQDFEAYDLYLRGKALWGQGGAPGIGRAAELCRAAVTRDAGFAAGWYQLARASFAKLIFTPQDAEGAIADATDAVGKAVELAPHWWATHVALALVQIVRRDWPGVEKSLRRARELALGNPPELSLQIGMFYGHVKDERALEQFRAASHDDPLSLLVSGLYQIHLHVAGRDAEAETEYRRSLDLAGDREMVEHCAIHRLWSRGAPFREQLRRYLDLTQTKPAPVLEEVYAVCDEPRLALEKLRRAAASPEYRQGTRQLVLAWWLAHYGDIDAAFDAAWRAYVETGHGVVAWLWWPVFARVREHARFPELLTRLGLVDYWSATGRTPPNSASSIPRQAWRPE